MEAEIAASHSASLCTYGSPRIHRDLREEAVRALVDAIPINVQIKNAVNASTADQL